jgi:hypothetical protein
MLLPKRQKHRKVRKGRIRGVATSGHYIAFGDYALQAQAGERITSRQIEAARQAMTRHIKRGGKIWIRIFPHTLLLPVNHRTLKWVAVKVAPNSSLPKYDQAQFCLRCRVLMKRQPAKRCVLPLTSYRLRPSF